MDCVWVTDPFPQNLYSYLQLYLQLLHSPGLSVFICKLGKFFTKNCIEPNSMVEVWKAQMKLNGVQFWPHLYKSLAQGTDPSITLCPVCPYLGKPHSDLRGYWHAGVCAEEDRWRLERADFKPERVSHSKDMITLWNSEKLSWGGGNSLALHDPRGQALCVETTGRQISSPNRTQTAPTAGAKGRWKKV